MKAVRRPDLIPRPVRPLDGRVDCPCCVATALDVECQGGLTETTPEPVESPSLVERAEAWYWHGGVPVVAALGGSIGFCLLVACCCMQSIAQDVSLFENETAVVALELCLVSFDG